MYYGAPQYNGTPQDQGGPRWDTMTKKSKLTKLFYIVLWYTQVAVAYDPVLLGGCIPSTFAVQLISQKAYKTTQKGKKCFFFHIWK